MLIPPLNYKYKVRTESPSPRAAADTSGTSSCTFSTRASSSAKKKKHAVPSARGAPARPVPAPPGPLRDPSRPLRSGAGPRGARRSGPLRRPLPPDAVVASSRGREPRPNAGLARAATWVRLTRLSPGPGRAFKGTHQHFLIVARTPQRSPHPPPPWGEVTNLLLFCQLQGQKVVSYSRIYLHLFHHE